jgi:hypothetical protein
MLDQAFRNVAKYAYALNQGPARFLMDPIYDALCAKLVPDSVPLSKGIQEAELGGNLYFKFRAQHRRLHYYIEDWDFAQADPSLLTPRQRQMMHTVALGETSGSAVADGFLRAFRTDPELAAFFGTWFVEELNHFIGYHLYLDRMGEKWPAQRGLDVARVDFTPYARDPMEIAAANMYQELVGWLVYSGFSTQAKDPFLARMLNQFAKDELRHYKFYQAVVARKIRAEPRFRRTVLKVILKATTPYNQVSGAVTNTLHHLEMGSFYFRKPQYDLFLREVQWLLGTPLKEFFDWYFTGIIPACTQCGQQMRACECEHYEDGQPPVTRNPTWWQQVSRQGRKEGELYMDGWIEEIRAMGARGRSSSPSETNPSTTLTSRTNASGLSTDGSSMASAAAVSGSIQHQV